MQNKDNQCLRWALRAALFPVDKNPQRPSKYRTDDGLDFTGISFPTPLHEIPKVEKLNNIAINVLYWKDGKAHSCLVSKKYGEGIPHVDLMLLTKGKKNTTAISKT